MKSNKKLLLKSLLIFQTIGLLAYTYLTFQTDGANFIGIAFGYISEIQWAGQFALDFACYLLLSGLWIIWRDKSSVSAIIAAVLAMIFGIVFFAPYIFYLVIKNKGDLKLVLLGRNK